MLRAGMIGCGRIFQEGHLAAFEAVSDRVGIVAVADPVQGRRDEAAQKLGISPEQCYADYAEMIRRVPLDLVDVATPHFLHRDNVIAAASAGLHVISEKPMATDLEEADAILQAVDDTGIVYSVFHNYLYEPQVVRIREMIAEGRIGEPFLVRIEMWGSSHYPGAADYDPDWRTRKSRSGGGCFIDNGYHGIYSAETYVGAPVERVYGRLGTFAHPIDVEDTALVTLEHANGAVTTMGVGWSRMGEGGLFTQEVLGTEGCIGLVHDDGWQVVLQGSRGETVEPVPKRGGSPGFEAILRRFLDAVEGDGEVAVPGDHARHILHVITSVYKSAASGQSVELSEC